MLELASGLLMLASLAIMTSARRSTPGVSWTTHFRGSMSRIVDSRTVLAVRDLRASTAFFIDALGFRQDFGDGSGGWSFLSRDAFKVMLGECPDERPAAELG